jgi:hypothetical protein
MTLTNIKGQHWLIAIAITVSVSILSYSFVHRNSFSDKNEIQVKGIGLENFESNLIVWEGNFYAMDESLQGSFQRLKNNRTIVLDFLINKGIKKSDIIFGAVSTEEKTETLYNSEGNRIGERFLGYQLRQEVKIESETIDLIEDISRSITEVLNQGVEFYSRSPRYYFTNLESLKHQLISKATQDAKKRAEIMAKEAGASIGDLKTADMGVFQIVGQNSTDEYSWGGTYNTSDRYKTASLTMDLTYEIEN